MRDRRVLLLGMMGAGKTSVGRGVAARTGWRYRDNDEAVEELTGLPTRELHEQRGTGALRAAEAQVLHDALVAPPPNVAGVAGGVVESDADVQALRDADAFVVYLHTPVDELVRRVGDGAGRPFLQPDPEAALRRLYAGREPLYRSVADLVVDTSVGDADAHADQVVRALTAVP
ncbi:MAG: shikimate kinase [Sporichthyaceae bacterium]